MFNATKLNNHGFKNFQELEQHYYDLKRKYYSTNAELRDAGLAEDYNKIGSLYLKAGLNKLRFESQITNDTGNDDENNKAYQVPSINR